MSEPYKNPYESPQVNDKQRSLHESQDLRSMAELHARVEELERRLARNWFYGPLWKRVVAVIGHFLLGYAFLFAIVGSVVWSIGMILALLGVNAPWE